MMDGICLKDCPYWSSCNANVCPLDPDWRLRQCLEGESVCFLMTEQSKDGGKDRLLDCSIPIKLLEHIELVSSGILESSKPVRKALRRSARTGSRIDRGRRLSAKRGGRHVDAKVT